MTAFLMQHLSSFTNRIAAHWRLRCKSHLGTLAMVLAVMWGVNAWQTRNHGLHHGAGDVAASVAGTS